MYIHILIKLWKILISTERCVAVFLKFVVCKTEKSIPISKPYVLFYIYISCNAPCSDGFILRFKDEMCYENFNFKMETSVGKPHI